jgi:phosphatidylglycerol---prolipoprotein diacylglyceryl transferase
MQFAIPFPDFDPVFFTIPVLGLPIRWYALAYIAGIFLGWRYVIAMNCRERLWAAGKPPMTREQCDDILTWMVLGVILGGRLGFVMFYQPDYYLANPMEIFKVWQGGMSFHGGFIGVIVAVILFSLRHRINPFSVGDLVAAAAPIGIFFGRLANFVNGELWGRPTDASWGVIFPSAAAQNCPPNFPEVCARHPSQLYEAALEGIVLFLVLAIAIWALGWLKRPGRVIGLFFVGYGLARIVVETFRQADPQFLTPDNPWGHVIRLTPEIGLTMGQVLSLPMLLIGIAALWLTRAK